MTETLQSPEFYIHFWRMAQKRAVSEAPRIAKTVYPRKNGLTSLDTKSMVAQLCGNSNQPINTSHEETKLPSVPYNSLRRRQGQSTIERK